jgi:glycerol uptake facilitator-like aquaporin
MVVLELLVLWGVRVREVVMRMTCVMRPPTPAVPTDYWQREDVEAKEAKVVLAALVDAECKVVVAVMVKTAHVVRVAPGLVAEGALAAEAAKEVQAALEGLVGTAVLVTILSSFAQKNSSEQLFQIQTEELVVTPALAVMEGLLAQTEPAASPARKLRLSIVRRRLQLMGNVRLIRTTWALVKAVPMGLKAASIIRWI